MRQYNIWNVVKSPDYALPFGKSFGANDYTTTTINVGTSSRNSFEFVKHEVIKSVCDDGTLDFQFFVDGELVKRAIYDTKNKTLLKVENE